MNVVYASNDNYARHLAVSLYSLLDHNRDLNDIHVYVLSMGLSGVTKERLKTVTDEFGRKLTVMELGDLKARFSYKVDTGGFDLSIMARLFVGEVLPEETSRILYLDCDTVVLSSLKNLWETDLKSSLLGAVMEPTIYPSIKEEIGLLPSEPYYNSGVLLIDMNRWKRKTPRRCFWIFTAPRAVNCLQGTRIPLTER